MNNKLRGQIIRHGEVIIKPVDKIPEGATLIEDTKKRILAFSETHHHHILEAQKPFKIWTWSGDIYIEVPELAKLWHQKTGSEAHKEHKIVPAFYKVVIKKSYDYFLKKLTQVRD